MATLLLADDSSTIQRVIELTFADEGIRVVSAGGGREAIDRIRAEVPDIVLADVGMPDCDGYEVGAFVKSDPAFRHIPVLLLTGALEPVDEARAQAVSDGVLVKPFEPQVVIARVRALLDGTAGRAAAAGPVPVTLAAPPRAPREAFFARLDQTFPGGPPAQDEGAPVAPRLGAETHGLSSARRGSVEVSLSEAFAALLAAEQGQPVLPAAPPAPAVTDETIDRIAERVIARMGDASMREAVLDAAERLVREEIARIKKG